MVKCVHRMQTFSLPAKVKRGITREQKVLKVTFLTLCINYNDLPMGILRCRAETK